MEELRFPTTASHQPGLLRAQGRKSRGSPRKPALVGTWGTATALPRQVPHHPRARLGDATALPSHVSPPPSPGSRSRLGFADPGKSIAAVCWWPDRGGGGDQTEERQGLR